MHKWKLFYFLLSAQPEIEEWSSWDEDAPTSIKIEGGNGNVSPSPNDVDEEPDYFKDMAPTIRKTQKVCPHTAEIQGLFRCQFYPYTFNTDVLALIYHKDEKSWGLAL